MARELREVLFVDGVRTPFGKAGPKGLYWKTRADDMAVKVVRELGRRNPGIEPGRIVVAGDSAGGNLGLALLLRLRDGGPRFRRAPFSCRQ